MPINLKKKVNHLWMLSFSSARQDLFFVNKRVIELKALKIYINSFMNRYISHENSANEIFDTLFSKLEPKWLKVVADFKPRGNVHTVIEIDSSKI